MIAAKIQINYYQFNDGRANNGHGFKFFYFDSESEARHVMNQILQSIDIENSEDWDGYQDQDFEFSSQLKDLYIPGDCGGYFTSVHLLD